MVQRCYFVFCITMCFMIRLTITMAESKNVLMDNDVVGPLAEQPEFQLKPYSGPGSAVGVTYDSKILKDETARKLLKEVFLSPSSVAQFEALNSPKIHLEAYNQSKVPIKPSKSQTSTSATSTTLTTSAPAEPSVQSAPLILPELLTPSAPSPQLTTSAPLAQSTTSALLEPSVLTTPLTQSAPSVLTTQLAPSALSTQSAPSVLPTQLAPPAPLAPFAPFSSSAPSEPSAPLVSSGKTASSVLSEPLGTFAPLSSSTSKPFETLSLSEKRKHTSGASSVIPSLSVDPQTQSDSPYLLEASKSPIAFKYPNKDTLMPTGQFLLPANEHKQFEPVKSSASVVSSSSKCFKFASPPTPRASKQLKIPSAAPKLNYPLPSKTFTPLKRPKRFFFSSMWGLKTSKAPVRSSNVSYGPSDLSQSRFVTGTGTEPTTKTSSTLSAPVTSPSANYTLFPPHIPYEHY